MVMSLTMRFCPSWPDDSWGTISVVAISLPSFCLKSTSYRRTPCPEVVRSGRGKPLIIPPRTAVSTDYWKRIVSNFMHTEQAVQYAPHTWNPSHLRPEPESSGAPLGSETCGQKKGARHKPQEIFESSTWMSVGEVEHARLQDHPTHAHKNFDMNLTPS